ncbi:hypothetical protein FHR83_003624 [Actinoplanes campanulatus]|uniref:Uncharacterized protein n=1 Tax=Actinoplanes campanulatus TaxID=113559 RepID=A0A7W5AHS1_9ACTN|nr:hypothetical protein [Actinoplanes campanulatus]MBB3095954.1 hypothetical protein [Actinoplanes campanulatus]GGN12662.1 hypothetical protein GCM10010109_23370 [Actinoplanes campanulatus]GID36951.1 hypothetical protein Aca09nite_34570 [Actinoplanes campanulatus]
MLMAGMSGNLGWGLVFITDSALEETGLPGAFDTEPDGRQVDFMSNETATVLRVQHGSDGDVAVRLWVGEEDWGNRGEYEIGATTISVPSGMIKVSDVLEQEFIQVAVESGNYRMQMNGDSPTEPAVVDLVLWKADDGLRRLHG